MKKSLMLIAVLFLTVSTFAQFTQKEKVYMKVKDIVVKKNNTKVQNRTVDINTVVMTTDTGWMRLIYPQTSSAFTIWKKRAYQEDGVLYVEGEVTQLETGGSLSFHLSSNTHTGLSHITLGGFKNNYYDTVIIIAE